MLMAFAAGHPGALELRGGPSPFTGVDDVRIEHSGANDSLGWISPGVVHGDDGVALERWFSNEMALGMRARFDAPSWSPPGTLVFGSAGAGQVMYTPRDVHVVNSAALDGDRPYSGWLALHAGADVLAPLAPLAFVNDAGAAFTHAGVTLFGGASGPWSFAGPTQHALHYGYLAARNEPVPPIVGYGVAETTPSVAIDVSAFVDTSLVATPVFAWLAGTRSDAGAMLIAQSVTTTMTAGWLRPPHGTSEPFAAFVVAHAEARGVLHNGAIETAVIDEERVVADAAPFVVDANVGVVLRAWNVELSGAHGWRSNETASLAPALQTGQWLWSWRAALLF
jgi:hypothetical protein